MRLVVIAMAALAGCGGESGGPEPLDPDTAPAAVIDRFSGEGAVMLDRAEMAGLPGPGEPVALDQAPFLVRGLGPGGERVVYYNLDAKARAPINIYRLYVEGQAEPVPDQLPIVDYIPGDHGYNDLWRVVRIDVPADYVANTATSSADISSWPFTVTTTLVNCPVFPLGSTATRHRGSESAEMHRGWYKDQVFYYFTFEEQPLQVVQSMVPVSAVYAAFNVNPGASGGGWRSGFMTESGGVQTHVVADALDAGGGYSPLRDLQVYDNAAFASVVDLASAAAAAPIASDELLWNAPIVEIAP